MKTELKWISISLYWVVLFAVVLPFLVSAASTDLVIAGFLVFGVSAYVTYRGVRSSFFPSEKPAAGDVQQPVDR